MQPQPYGYYSVTFYTPGSKRLLHTNNERAFIISQLQDLLSPRLLISSVPAYKQMASCIDLLAFSITSSQVQLVVFAIDGSVITQLASSICSRLLQYQNEYHPTAAAAHYQPYTSIKKLRGPHQALGRSITLHLLHEDWEYDRYSSIGFYLHDRRGDWMRMWRLTQLYDNDPQAYRMLVIQHARQALAQSTSPASTMPLQSYAS